MAEGESGPALRSRAVLERCASHGFALAGIAAAMPSRRAAEYRAWIAAARHGGMSYLAESVEARLDPRVLLPGARSVLCVADRYADGSPDARVPGLGRIARYARGEDYHVVIRARRANGAGDGYFCDKRGVANVACRPVSRSRGDGAKGRFGRLRDIERHGAGVARGGK
jgi:hypothetical protein